MARLVQKVALISGAARGIGAGIARAFRREGAQVLLTDADASGGEALAREVGASFLQLDVRGEDDWRAALDFVKERFGRLDVLVNNAGVTGFEDHARPQNPEELSLEDWHAVLAVNLDGVMLGCKYAIQMMRANGAGSIINIGSRSGLVGIPAAAPYAASKAAVRNHTKTVALYCAEQGLRIRCNVIQPAAILTPMWAPMLGPDGPERDANIQKIVRDTPLRRFGTVEEVAELALYLAEDASAYMTGAELNLDGGILAGSAATPEPQS